LRETTCAKQPVLPCSRLLSSLRKSYYLRRDFNANSFNLQGSLKQEIAFTDEYNFTILRLYDATRNNSPATTAQHDEIEELDVRN
jgi:hypothetical protein